MRQKCTKAISFLLICCLLCSYVLSSVSVCYATETEDYKTFSQGDPRWGSHVPQSPSFGGNYTLARAGCFITAISILMAYANPELRDVNKFNPAVLSDKMSFSGGGLVSTSTTNADPTFTKVADDDANGKFTASEALAKIEKYFKQGYYCTIMCGPPIAAGSTHFTAVVGFENGKPVVWDVNNGKNSDWDKWADCGIQQIDVFASSISKSYDTMSGKDSINAIESQQPQTAEEYALWQKRVEECNLEGMPDAGKLQENLIDIALPTSEGLTLAEANHLASIQERMNSSGLNILFVFHIFTELVGILLIFYGVILIVAYLFDYTNTFIEISLLSLISFGKFRIMDEEYLSENLRKNGTKRKGITYLTKKMLIFRVFVIELLGFMIVSGFLYDIVYFIFLHIVGRW